MSADLLDLFVDGRLGIGALVNVNDQPVVVADEADIEALLELVPLAANHDPIPVTVRLWAGNDRVDLDMGKSPDPLEQVGNLFVFELELGWITEVLILTAAPNPKIRTSWPHTRGRGDQDLEQAGPGKALLQLDNLHLRPYSH